jgi:hypothetical protein
LIKLLQAAFFIIDGLHLVTTVIKLLKQEQSLIP